MKLAILLTCFNRKKKNITLFEFIIFSNKQV